MSTGDLLIEVLGEDVDTDGVLGVVGPEGDLGENLVGERARHDPRGVASGASVAGSVSEGTTRRARIDQPEVDETSLGEEDDVAARGHGVTVNLGLDVGGLDGVGLDPGDVDLDVKVTDAARNANQLELEARTHETSATHLQTMASSGMAEKCSPRMMSRQPVVVTKMFPWGAASSMVVTSKPAIAAWRALMGSISVMMTRDP